MFDYYDQLPELVPASRFRRELKKWLKVVQERPIAITLNGQKIGYVVGRQHYKGPV